MKDALLTVQKWHAIPAEREPAVESPDVRHVFTELSAENRERGETRAPNVFVAHVSILSDLPRNAKRPASAGRFA